MVIHHLTDTIILSELIRLESMRYPFLLESTASSDNSTMGNYDILFAFPEKSIVKYAHDSTHSFLESITPLVKKPNTHNLPFIGGYFVYLSYEMVAEVERIHNLPESVEPIAYAVQLNNAVLYNHTTQRTTIVADSKEKLDTVLADINAIANNAPPTINTSIPVSTIEDKEEHFINAVQRCKDYIIAGDIFQTNLSREWNLTLENSIEAIDIYNTLMQCNPAPFSAYADFKGMQILSSSPERLFSVHHNIIETRPIAGTRPRGDESTDSTLKTELRENLKEQAEHVMLLDLERNDLGRVCAYGSVEVNEVMTVESYKYVHHIVSNIRGELQENVSFKDIIHALFPGGTITGCPKVRSMEIISELEAKPRGAYTGSLGYISACGNMDFNILIRTITKYDDTLSIKAGAGIVYDSIPEKELEETRHKARGMLKVFDSST